MSVIIDGARAGHSGNLWQVLRWALGERRVPTLHKECTIINDPGAWKGKIMIMNV